MSYQIVERLRAWSPMIASGYEVPAASAAMDEAATLIEELAAALEPLATVKVSDNLELICLDNIQLSDVIRARAALAKLKGETNAD